MTRLLLALGACFLSACSCGAPAAPPPSPAATPPSPSVAAPVSSASQAPTATAAPANPTDVRVFLGSAPDDGPAFVVATGPIGPDGCNPPPRTKQGFRIALATKRLPSHYRVETKNQDEIEGRICRDGRCSRLVRGTVELDAAAAGEPASGTIRVEGDGVSLSRRFEATWCGPTDRQPWQAPR